jgi:N utilization substance protein B
VTVAGQRRKSRIIALKALYEMDTVAHQPQDILARLLEEAVAPPDVEAFARELVTGVLEHQGEIDEVIRQKAPAWPLEQVAVVDRNILRLAIFEILLDNRVPVRAAINEAVELAKAFGGESSPKFVNGVLGAVSLMATR